ncbi:protein Njmu-R1-like isoform X2 [Rhopilema esculentum]|uniref:protein Njmu-R1-like isoform X2 n=1 Tax=Rhopilema esculentum TaxID=499914 RepID=UPI0031D1D633
MVNISKDEITEKDVATQPDKKATQQPVCRLSLLSSNIQADLETSLRYFLTKRLEKMHPLEGSGNIIAIPAGKVYDQNAMVYFYSMDEESSESLSDNSTEGQRNSEDPKRSFLVCFIAVIETGLELFQNELDNYCKQLSPYIHKYMESVDVSEYLKRLEAWYDSNICYIQRCFSYLSEELSTILFTVFVGDEIELKDLPEDIKHDLEIFISCCSLSELLQDRNLKDDTELSTSLNSQSTLANETSLVVKYSEETLELSSQRTNPFCQDCVKSMRQLGQCNPFKLRQVIENYKLKVIQDMNTFKRLTKQAETDYYALYRSFAFLLTCDNGEVLLRNAKTQFDEEDSASFKDVLNVIQRFVDNRNGFENIYKQERQSKIKSQNLLRLLHC